MGSVLKLEFQSSRNLVEKNLVFHRFQIHDGTKNSLNTLSHQLLAGISLEVPKKYTLFFISNALFNSASVLLNFLIN